MATIENKECVVYDSVIEMETIVCYKCAIPFAVPSNYKRYLKESQDNFYCPNGHQQAYAKSTSQILKEKIARLESEKQEEKERLQRVIKFKESQVVQKTKETIALKSKHTKFKNRIANGVCPCCNRTFQNLHEHMKSQHPEFKPKEPCAS